jgi:hypothetical protein
MDCLDFIIYINKRKLNFKLLKDKKQESIT